MVNHDDDIDALLAELDAVPLKTESKPILTIEVEAPNLETAIEAAKEAINDAAESIPKVEKKKRAPAKKKEEPKKEVQAQPVAEVKKEEPKPKKAAIDPDKIIHLDLNNLDDRKTIFQLMDEGKILHDTDDRRFVMSFNPRPPYAITNPPAHRIYVDEIKHVTVTSYFKDLINLDIGEREFIRKVIWVYHSGYSTHNIIREEDFLALQDEGLLKDICYSFIDVTEGRSFWGDHNSAEPTREWIQKKLKEEERIRKEMNGGRDTVVLPKSLQAIEKDEEEKTEELPEAVADTLPELPDAEINLDEIPLPDPDDMEVPDGL